MSYWDLFSVNKSGTFIPTGHQTDSVGTRCVSGQPQFTCPWSLPGCPSDFEGKGHWYFLIGNYWNLIQFSICLFHQLLKGPQEATRWFNFAYTHTMLYKLKAAKFHWMLKWCGCLWSGPLSNRQNDCQHQCRREVCHSISRSPQPAAEETLGPSAQCLLPTKTSRSNIT